MTLSEPFIRRPIGTTLLALGLLMLGFVAYRHLPIAGLPTVELPSISISASRPGADPETMARTVAAPLERRLGKIAGVTGVWSFNTLGITNIWMEFELGRSVDGAARDVQAALNAAATDLPSDMPNPPTFRKTDPNGAPILVIALTSPAMTPAMIFDVADTTIAQRLMQVPGVADVTISGSEQPAVRVRVNPSRLAAMGVSLDAVRRAISESVALGPVGSIDGADQTFTIATNDQMRRPASYANLAVRTVDGNTVRLGAVAELEEGVRNSRAAAWFDGRPAVILNITKQPNSNVIETVSAVKALLPELTRWVPASIEVTVVADRTTSVRTSVEDMEKTLAVTVGLVMLVVFVFLRRGAATLAAGVTVPLAFAGTFAAMWLVGYSIDNLSLMALAIAVGFIVDDAIVMVENIERKIGEGLTPMRAAIEGASQIALTVVAISIALLAAFIPLIFIGGITGRYFREFALTLAFAVGISTVVALTLTPMICAHLIRPGGRPANWFDRLVEGVTGALHQAYARSLPWVLRHRYVALVAVLLTTGATVWLYIATPKGLIPEDDTGLVGGWVGASSDVSFPAMVELQKRVAARVAEDPAVRHVSSSVGGSGWAATVNNGRLTIVLKPPAERDASTQQVLERLRKSTRHVAGADTWFWSIQDVRLGGGGQGQRSPYQFTLWGDNYGEIQTHARRAVQTLKTVPGITDASGDQSGGSGLQATVVVDREEAARLGVSMQDVSSALQNAFAQRQVATLYGRRNQYRVVLEVEAEYRQDPNDLALVYVPSKSGRQVPLSAIARVEQGPAPLTIRHQNQFPSSSISYSVTPGTKMADALSAVRQAVAELHLPESVRVDFDGDLRALRRAANDQPLLILAAILTVYIVLGVLYESLAHPLTILSTLPAAGLGALLVLQATGTELSVIAFIGIILLIGIVMKNGILLVDFAIEAERERGLTPEQAALEGSLARFRPILMTTLAAMLGALPLVLATGPGSELRRPLGLTIVGGLLVSQLLTLYTTPAIYVLMDRLAQRLTRRRRRRDAPPVPAE
ncbi:efflux RND transporter permease subunit [Alsobacter sp. R-9]